MTAHNVWDWISLSIIALTLYPFLRFVITGKYIYVTLFVLVFGVYILTTVCKRVFSRFDNKHMFRPDGAKDCDLLCRDGNVTGAPGMPSGHMAVTSFVLLSLYFIEAKKSHHHVQTMYTIFAFTYLVMMGASRYKKKCHTIPQIGLGVLLGAAMAILMFGSRPKL